jgi:hypothetical protein
MFNTNCKLQIAQYKTDILTYRKYLLSKANNITVIKHGDTRVKNIRYCNCCGRLLTNYSYKISSYKVCIKYKKMLINNKESYYICYNDTVCLNYLLKQKGKTTITIYKVV